MKFWETDFCREEQSVIDKLRQDGYFVYGLRDGEGEHYTIEPKVYVNNIGFIVTDEPIKFHEEGSYKYITDTELREIGEEDPEISRKIDTLGEALCGWVS